MSQITCKPLNECTADDITPIDERLRADCVDYLAGNGREVSHTGPDHCSVEHLLHLCGEVDESVGCGPGEDGIITICIGGFAGHFARPAKIAYLRVVEHEQAERAALRVRNGDLRALAPADEERVAAELELAASQQIVLERVAAGLVGTLGPYPRCTA